MNRENRPLNRVDRMLLAAFELTYFEAVDMHAIVASRAALIGGCHSSLHAHCWVKVWKRFDAPRLTDMLDNEKREFGGTAIGLSNPAFETMLAIATSQEVLC